MNKFWKTKNWIYVIDGSKEVIKKNSRTNSVDYKGDRKIFVIFLTIFWKWIASWIPTIFSLYRANIQGYNTFFFGNDQRGTI